MAAFEAEEEEEGEEDAREAQRRQHQLWAEEQVINVWCIDAIFVVFYSHID